jgi:hypothetical protein
MTISALKGRVAMDPSHIQAIAWAMVGAVILTLFWQVIVMALIALVLTAMLLGFLDILTALASR